MKLEIEFTPSLADLAEYFCSLTDEEQAQFFIEIEKIMSTWGSSNKELQAYAIGRHLRICACSSQDVLDFLKEISMGAGIIK